MKNNDSTQMSRRGQLLHNHLKAKEAEKLKKLMITESFINHLKAKEIINEIKKLRIATQPICSGYDDCSQEHDDPNNEHHNCNSEKAINAIVKQCKSGGKEKPRDTVEKLEKLLMDSEFTPNQYFFVHYISCLACSCKKADTSHTRGAVDKLIIIMENMEDSDNEFIFEKYIFCLCELSKKDNYDIENVKFTFSKMAEVASRPHLIENDFFNEHYNRIKQLLKKHKDEIRKVKIDMTIEEMSQFFKECEFWYFSSKENFDIFFRSLLDEFRVEASSELYDEILYKTFLAQGIAIVGHLNQQEKETSWFSLTDKRKSEIVTEILDWTKLMFKYITGDSINRIRTDSELAADIEQCAIEYTNKRKEGVYQLKQALYNGKSSKLEMVYNDVGRFSYAFPLLNDALDELYDELPIEELCQN